MKEFHLVVGAELFAVSSEGQESVCGVHQTPDLQTVVVPSLSGAAVLSSPHHVAVTALYTE